MAKTNWKKLANKDYLGSWDIEGGSDLVLTIRNITQKPVKNPQGKEEDCIICEWKENYKPMILNATNCKAIAKAYNTEYIEDWVGKPVSLFTTMVSAFGDTTEAIRIRPYAPRVEKKVEIVCEECGQIVKGANGMDAEQIAVYTKNKYGKQLCTECASKLKNGGNQ
jgi:hypothetical protein